MYKGGVTINQRTAQIIRFAGLLVPVILLLYGALVQYGIVDSQYYAGNKIFFFIMTPWIAIACYQFLRTSSTRFDSFVRLLIYHVLSGCYILFVSGFTTPFVAAWALLFLASYAYFAGTGLRLSIISFVIITSADILLHGYNSATLLGDMITAIVVLVIGLSAVSISHVQEVDGAELLRSRALETLQRDRILTIVNNLADAILSTDKNGIIQVYNAASLNLLDTNKSLNGLRLNEVLTLHDKDNAIVNLYDDLQKTHGVVVRDDLTMQLEDEIIRLEITYSPIRSNYSRSKKREAQDGYIIILRDVTKAKSLEEERDEFISVVSHELRTPITIAEGTISNVQVMMDRPNIAESILKQGIATAHDQVIFLAKMVNDLSTLSRAERGVADAAETIEVRALIDDLYKEYAPQAEAKKLHFNLDLDTHLGEIEASRLYLHELLQNFITNALKYTKEGSITLEVARKKDTIHFAVKDTGIGISKSDQAKVFNKFYRSEDYRTRETGGTGLGLYVAAKLSKKLGTTIELSSRLNHGSTFSFTLPAVK